jgi:ATP adenylyltransferase
MEPLWAPWRMEFIEGKKKPEGCIFCVFPAQSGPEADRENLIVARSAHSFAILNRYPYNNGHLMVVPRRHTAAFSSFTEPEWVDLHQLLRESVEVVKTGYSPAGFNLGMNLGQVAGAGIADHLHYHIVPRWGGDTNFMPVLSDTKVMVEHLGSSYEKLKRLFEHRGPGGAPR